MSRTNVRRRSKINKETIRTVAAVISDFCGIAGLIIQAYGLHYIMTHPR